MKKRRRFRKAIRRDLPTRMYNRCEYGIQKTHGEIERDMHFQLRARRTCKFRSLFLSTKCVISILAALEVWHEVGGRENPPFIQEFKASGSNLACAPFCVSFFFRASASCMPEILRAGERKLIKETDRLTTNTIEDRTREPKGKINEECSRETVRKSRRPRKYQVQHVLFHPPQRK